MIITCGPDDNLDSFEELLNIINVDAYIWYKGL
jgi:hypothetical protein